MKGTGAGWDSCLYRIFVVLGILLIVAVTIGTALTQPPGSKLPIYAGVCSVAGFVAIFLLYWVVQIIIKGYNTPKAVDLTLKQDVNNPAILENWQVLFASMAVNTIDPATMKQLEKQGRSTQNTWFILTMVLTICPITLMVPYIFGFVDWSIIQYGVACYVGLVVVMVVVSIVLGNRSAKISNDLYFTPLGLKLTELPQVMLSGDSPRVRGGTVVEGLRFNRPVRITMDIAHVSVEINFPAPPFTINSQGGQLQADSNAPKEVLELLQTLPKAKYWGGAKFQSNGHSLISECPIDGVNSWLYDLWLIERILEKLKS